MASIITQRPPAKEREKLTNPEINTKYHKDVVVDSRYENLANLITHVEGANWKVTYYQQVLDESTGLAGQNIGKDEIYQQYIKIEGFVLKVDTALTWSQNQERKSGSVSGSATVFPPFIPNAGDMFVADVGDGEPAIFQINESEKLSWFKQAAYKVEYTVVDYARGIRIVDLDNKVIDTRYFEMDYLEHGQNPILLKNEEKLYKTILHYQPIILENYFKKYYSTRYRCMVLPRSDMFIYDHFLTRCISRWFNSDHYHKLSELNVLPHEHLRVLKAESVFDMLEDGDYYASRDIFTKVGMVSPKTLSSEAEIPQLSYVGLDQVIVPIDHRYSIDLNDRDGTRNLNKSPSPIPNFLYDQEFQHEFNGTSLLPDINLANSYIFSESFYQFNTSGMSQIELQVYRHLEGNNITADVMFELLKTYMRWSTLQQFYLTPILHLLMIASIRKLK